MKYAPWEFGFYIFVEMFALGAAWWYWLFAVRQGKTLEAMVVSGLLLCVAGMVLWMLVLMARKNRRGRWRHIRHRCALC